MRFWIVPFVVQHRPIEGEFEKWRKVQYLVAGEASTIGWRSQTSWRGYNSRCRHHRCSTDVTPLDETRVSTCYYVRNEQLEGPTQWHYRLPSRNTVNGKQWILEGNCSIPINFFNECWEVGKGSDITMFRKSSFEDIVKFCLGLLLHLGIAGHRQEKGSDCRSSGICSRWGIALLTKKRGERCNMGGLTQIRLDGNIF